MKEKYPDFWSVILGDKPIGFLLGYIAVSIISALAIILVMASQKYKAVPGSPEKWSWGYFIRNNAGNFIACFFLLPIVIRVLFAMIDSPLWMLIFSVGAGLGFYRLAKLANDFGIWTTDKISEKFSEKIKQSNDMR